MTDSVSLRRLVPGLAILLLILPGAGCTTTTYNAFLSDAGMKQFQDIPYGSDDRHRLDVYRPANMNSPRPVIIFVHGGAWNRGSKDQYFFVARSLVDRGYMAVLPNYRLYPEVAYPDFIRDTARAVAWTLKNIDKYGGRRDSVYLMGHSAGAYNASMVAYADNFLERHDVKNEKLQGFIGLAGLYDFLPLERKHMVKIFGGTDRKDHTQPVRYIDPDDPPALLLHGRKDILVNPKNSQSMGQALKQNGATGKVHINNSLNHVYLILSVGPYFRGDYDTLDRVDKFIRGHLSARTASACGRGSNPLSAQALESC